MTQGSLCRRLTVDMSIKVVQHFRSVGEDGAVVVIGGIVLREERCLPGHDVAFLFWKCWTSSGAAVAQIEASAVFAHVLIPDKDSSTLVWAAFGTNFAKCSEHADSEVLLQQHLICHWVGCRML